jgi:hypothetical protein
MKTLLPCHHVPFGLAEFDTGIQFRRWPQAHPSGGTSGETYLHLIERTNHQVPGAKRKTKQTNKKGHIVL